MMALGKMAVIEQGRFLNEAVRPHQLFEVEPSTVRLLDA
jgi:hypothetical protein